MKKHNINLLNTYGWFKLCFEYGFYENRLCSTRVVKQLNSAATIQPINSYYFDNSENTLFLSFIQALGTKQ